MRVALKGIKGVETVDVSLNKGLATISFTEGNTVTMKQLRDAIGKNGFTTKSSNVLASGQLLERTGALGFQVSKSSEEWTLLADGNTAANKSLVGKGVTLEGTVPELPTDNSPIQVRPKSIVEDR
ncbi:MAG: heavy-metal-associated domain-containing protein [Acidobacteriales bacterium]|nr:heavy-metal-associated domain-containing protein [Terriglobales bacterium]